MTQRLLILCTGGTIAMVPSEHGLAPSTSFPDILRAFVAQEAAQALAVDVEPLGEPIDSANATPHDWLRIAQALVGRWADHDAFVVLHGTDTLAFTASALAFTLGRRIDKPVLLTGAQRPWGAADSDGPRNVRLAIAAARALPGMVSVAFGGRLLRGVRATKVSSTLDEAFDSPNASRLSLTGGDEPRSTGIASFRPCLAVPNEAGVALVHCLPGMSARWLDALFDARPAAILLSCFGGATLPAMDGAMHRFLQRARAQGLALGAISQVPHGGVRPGAYAAGQLLSAHAVADGRDMTLEAAYTKLHHLVALGLDVSSIEAQFARSLVGELSEPAPA